MNDAGAAALQAGRRREGITVLEGIAQRLRAFVRQVAILPAKTGMVLDGRGERI